MMLVCVRTAGLAAALRYASTIFASRPSFSYASPMPIQASELAELFG